MLEINNISKSYGNKCIFKAASAVVPDGCIAGLFGPSGTGKSSLAKMITGLEHPDSGSIIFDGMDIYSCGGSPAFGIQMVFQQPYAVLDPRQSVRSGFEEIIKYHNIKLSDMNCASLEEYVSLAGLDKDVLSHMPLDISGGEAQRISVLKSLLFHPGLLILDEATSMLDVSTQANLLSFIKKQMKNDNASVLFISHDSELIKNYCDFSYILDNYRLIKASSGLIPIY